MRWLAKSFYAPIAQIAVQSMPFTFPNVAALGSHESTDAILCGNQQLSVDVLTNTLIAYLAVR